MSGFVNLFTGGGGPDIIRQPVQRPAATPRRSDAEVQAEAEAARRRARRAQGRASTLLSDGDLESENVRRKQLLGGE